MWIDLGRTKIRVDPKVFGTFSEERTPMDLKGWLGEMVRAKKGIEEIVVEYVRLIKDESEVGKSERDK